MDDSRYGRPSRLPALLLGLPVAVLLAIGGGFFTLASWGLFGYDESKSLSVVGPLLAGFGIALGWVCLRPRR